MEDLRPLADYKWVAIAGPNTNNFLLTPTGFWGWGFCGLDGTAGAAFSDTDAFQVIVPVGGEIIPIQAIPLVIAGLQTNALWLLPLVGLAAGSFAVLRFQIMKNKK